MVTETGFANIIEIVQERWRPNHRKFIGFKQNISWNETCNNPL